MDINVLREAVMIAALLAFGGIVWWAYAPSRKQRFELDARSVFDDELRDGESRVALALVRETRNIPHAAAPLPVEEGRGVRDAVAAQGRKDA